MLLDPESSILKIPVIGLIGAGTVPTLGSVKGLGNGITFLSWMAGPDAIPA